MIPICWAYFGHMGWFNHQPHQPHHSSMAGGEWDSKFGRWWARPWRKFWWIFSIRILYGCWTKNRGYIPPKWMVKIMENPIKMDDLGGTLIFGNTHISERCTIRGLMLQKSQGQPTVWMVLNTLLNNWDIFTNLNWLISRISSTINNFSPGKKIEPTFEPQQSLRASPTKIHQILEKSSSSKQPPWLVGVFFLEAWSLTNRWTLGFSPSFLKMQFVDFLFV